MVFSLFRDFALLNRQLDYNHFINGESLMLKNNADAYGLVHKLMHWVTALIFIGLFAVGFWMVDLSYYSDWYRTAPDLHKSFGLTLLAISLFRVVWVLINSKPKSLSDNQLEARAGHIAHLLLYVGLFVIMISGYLISTADGRGIEWFGLFEIPSFGEFIDQQEDVAGDIHKWGAYIILGLVGVHVVAALKHHFINKDNTLKRML